MDRFPPQALRTSPFVYYDPKQNISLKKHELKKHVTAGFQLVLKWVSRIEIPNHSPLNMNEELLPYDLVPHPRYGTKIRPAYIARTPMSSKLVARIS